MGLFFKNPMIPHPLRRKRGAWQRCRLHGDVHSGFKFAAVIAVRLGCYGLAVVGIIATLRVAFGR
jgi:hypothetical protein